MALVAGIIGLPLVGKTTLFNALTSLGVSTDTYSKRSGNINTGIVQLIDERVITLAKIFNSKKTIFTTFEFRDVSGIEKGSTKGDDFTNTMLNGIREVDALTHVIRCFEDENVFHVEETIDPIRDLETINLELILSDLDLIERRLIRIEKRAATLKEKSIVLEQETLKIILKALSEEKPARSVPLTKEQQAIARGFNLLTMKPVIYVANMGAEDIGDYENNKHYLALKEYLKNENSPFIALCAKLEAEISSFDEEDKAIFMEEYKIKQTGLDQMKNETYKALGLATYLTVGVQEARAWTFKVGMKAPECAGIIHSDFERGFIRAAIYHFEDLVKYGSEQLVKEAGKIRLEGKEYIMQDGDIVHFRFNI